MEWIITIQLKQVCNFHSIYYNTCKGYCIFNKFSVHILYMYVSIIPLECTVYMYTVCVFGIKIR